MKNLKQGKKRVKRQEKRRAARVAFMSMGLPAEIVKGINREMRKAS